MKPASIGRNPTALALSICAIIFLLPGAAYAQAVGGGGLFDSFTNLLTALVDVLTGVWARLVGIIAIFVAGILWLSGRLEMRHFIAVIGGLILVFGAAAIVDGVAGAV